MEWRAVPGFDGYEVSDSGTVRSVDRVLTSSVGWSRFHCGVELSPCAWTKAGHLGVLLYSATGRRMVGVHQLVLLAFVGSCPDGFEVLHNNGDPADNRLANLRYGTRSENVSDSVRHGTHANAAKTHCSRGHLLVAPNLRRTYRSCLACHRASARVFDARRAGRSVPEHGALADQLYEKIMT